MPNNEWVVFCNDGDILYLHFSLIGRDKVWIVERFDENGTQTQSGTFGIRSFEEAKNTAYDEANEYGGVVREAGVVKEGIPVDFGMSFNLRPFPF